MFTRRGLSKKTTGMTALRVTALVATLITCVAQAVVLGSGQSINVPLVHSTTMILIALATYCWVLLPVGVSITMSVLVLLTTVWALSRTEASVLGADLVALVVLTAFVSVHERGRRLRVHRLEQSLDDLEEEAYVKEQNLKITQQTHVALDHKLSRYQQLQVIAEQLSQLVDLQAIAQLAVQRAFDLIGKSDACMLFLVDKDRQELSLVAAQKGAQLPAIRTKQGDQFDRYVLRTQRPLLVNDVMRDFRFSHGTAPDRAVRSVMACPVRVAQNASGVMRLDSHRAGIYTQDDLRFLDILLDLVDAAIANARLFTQTQQLALTDGLTGLYRRQPLLEQLNREMARAGRTHEAMAVLMLDLDDFKRYNDTYGHGAGDVVLKGVAEVVRRQSPPDALSARYGGEEFAVLLPKSGRADAERVAAAIHETVGRDVHKTGDGPGRPVTVSIGVAVYPEDASSAMELIRRADERLYEAKRGGKNRVCST